MTHFYAAEVVRHLRRKGYDVPPTVSVTGDTTPALRLRWKTQCDKYVIPAEDLRDEYIKQGAKSEQLFPYGIPVSRAFEPEEADKPELEGWLG